MTSIHQRLGTIKKNLRAIEDITARMGAEPDQEALSLGLARRAALVSAIMEERSRLDERNEDWRRRVVVDRDLTAEKREIESRFEAITRMDALLVNGLQQQMQATRREIRGLHGSSRAARAYTAQSTVSRS